MRKHKAHKIIFFVLLSLCFMFHASCFNSSFAHELTEEQALTMKTATSFSYNLQKYTGFNLLMDFLSEGIIKSIVKFKTKAKDVYVDLDIYSGWDLIRKKAKSLSIKASNLFIKNVPIELFDITLNGPIYFKKNNEKQNRVVFPVEIVSNTTLNISNVNEVLNSLPKWQKVLKEIELPIPPLGTTKVALTDLEIMIDLNGHVEINSTILSLVKVNPNTEPLKVVFSANLVVKEEKIILDDLQSNVEDIFERGSDIEKSFSDMLEELINPIFDFHKFEKNGLKIDDVNLLFEPNKLLFELRGRLLSGEIENKN